MNSNIILNDEQKKALKIMHENGNVFLTGEAGTGKSTVLKAFMNQTKKNVVIVAPTGVAAINAGGTTIHSFFQFPCTVLKANELEGIRSPKRKELIKNTDVVIIDEISMVRSDVFSAIDTRLRFLGDSSKPFGGKQIIVCGDFFQLPPFAVTSAENIYLKTVFGGIYAFETAAWKNNFETVFLKTVHRQTDRVFAEILAKLRKNDMTSCDIMLPNYDEPMTALEALNTTAVRKPDENAITLCTRKNEAFAINIKKAAEITAPVHRFTAKVSGDFKEALYPTSECLELKVGERVMTLANKYEGQEMIYCNGDMGKIIAIDDEMVTVEFDKGIVAEIKPYVWSQYDYELIKENSKTKLIQKEVARFCQIPLRLAYAITVHKAQGLTLNSSHIVLGNGCFAAGQCYTALSRIRSLDGLTLDREIKSDDLFFAPEVISYYNEIDSKEQQEVVNLEIPAAYAEKMKRILAELIEKENLSA